MNRCFSFIALVTLVLALQPQQPSLAAMSTCIQGSGASAGDHEIGATIWRNCDHSAPSDIPIEPKVLTKTVDCGPRSAAGGFAAPTGENCTKVLAECALPTGEKASPNTTVTITLERQPDGSWKVTGHDCAAPVAHASGPSGTDVRDAVRKLVTGPRIGVAPPGGVTLVNMQTLLWLDTPADRNLGTVVLVRQQVTIQIHLDHVTWTFGDTTTDTTDTPGKPYTATDPCTTATCPNYYGHIYRDTGTRHLTATATWTGRYRIADGAWQSIPGTVTGPTMTSTLTVRQARGILVPDPAET